MELITLGSIMSMKKGKKPKVMSRVNKSGYVPYVDIKAFEDRIIDNYADPEDCLLCEDGDILIVCDGSRSGLVGKAIAGAVGSTLAVISAIGCSNDYLYYFLQSLYTMLNTKKKGTGTPHLNPEILKNAKLVVPPLPEQKRIVSRIEELFSQLDASVADLQAAKKRLKVYRQAVLKEAFEGIQNIVPFGEIMESRLGKMLDKQKNKGIPRKYLRNINVRWFSFDLSDLLKMRIDEDEIEKYSIHKGDLVICEGGEPGRCAVWMEDEPIFYQKALHRIRFTVLAEPKFYMYYLWFAAQTGQLQKYFTGTGIKHLTGQSLVKIPVPFTDIRTQREILSIIESRLSVCDSIEKTIDTALQQAEALRQSILKQAFEGKL